MSFQRMKPFWIGAGLFGLLFVLLFSIRIGLLRKPPPASPAAPLSGPSAVIEKDTWKNVFQNGHKIGFSHSVWMKTDRAYRLEEILSLRIHAMGLVRDVTVRTSGTLHTDLTLVAFDMRISSGRLQYTARGSVSDHRLTIRADAAGKTEKIVLPLSEPIYLFSGMLQAVAESGLASGDRRSFFLFDPVTMGKAPVEIKAFELETLHLQGKPQQARKVSFTFKGITQHAWIGESGEIVKESGLLGITLERTSQADALSSLPVAAGPDLTLAASIAANLEIEHPAILEKLTVKLEGVPEDNPYLNGGRQVYKDGILEIRKESISDLVTRPETGEIGAEYLAPAPFIQSDHPKIKSLATAITAEAKSPLSKAIKLVSWLEKHIEKRPVLTLPDALTTLHTKQGDCNEHAVLMAALARAAGIPAKLEAGLVYLNGRFYYHAWNLLFLGRWITADAALGQMPADVTHMRFSSGAHALPLDLLGIIGNINVTIIGLDG